MGILLRITILQGNLLSVTVGARHTQLSRVICPYSLTSAIHTAVDICYSSRWEMNLVEVLT